MQEFSIEIPDKEADSIHSGTSHPRPSPYPSAKVREEMLTLHIVEQAVNYILAQPDAN